MHPWFRFVCFVVENITYGDLLTVLPFGNTADILEIKGEHLLQAFEHGVTKWNPTSPRGAFLQVSGNVIRNILDK